MGGERGAMWMMNERYCRECCFTSVVGLPTPPVIDGGRTHRVPSNMAGTKRTEHEELPQRRVMF